MIPREVRIRLDVYEGINERTVSRFVFAYCIMTYRFIVFTRSVDHFMRSTDVTERMRAPEIRTSTELDTRIEN